MGGFISIVADSSGDVKCPVRASGTAVDSFRPEPAVAASRSRAVDVRFRFLCCRGDASDWCLLLDVAHCRPLVRQKRHELDESSMLQWIFRRRQLSQAGNLCELDGQLVSRRAALRKRETGAHRYGRDCASSEMPRESAIPIP